MCFEKLWYKKDMNKNFTIAPERPQDSVYIAELLDRAFGSGRFARAAYRLREGRAPVAALSFVARMEARVIGSVRFWPIQIGARAALLLGPIAVAAEWQGQGAARALIEHGCAAARDLGHALVILIGDLDYYQRVGFVRLTGDVSFPPHIDYARLLVRPLKPGAEENLSGAITALKPAAAKFCGYESVLIEERQ